HQTKTLSLHDALPISRLRRAIGSNRSGWEATPTPEGRNDIANSPLPNSGDAAYNPAHTFQEHLRLCASLDLRASGYCLRALSSPDRKSTRLNSSHVKI